jgi:TonB family protein
MKQTSTACLAMLMMLVVSTRAWQGFATNRQPAEAGDPAAQYRLGIDYRDGNGVPKNLARAHLWLGLAALLSSGDLRSTAQTDLNGVAKGMTAAEIQEAERTGFAEVQRLADAGHAWAQFSLGVMLEEGKGVRPDRIEAHKWMNLGAVRAPVGANAAFAARRDRLAASMTPVEVAEAQKRASEWLTAAAAGLASAVESSAPVRVGSTISPPARLKYVAPVYPEKAIAARIQGQVLVEATIGADGAVRAAKILRSPSPLLEAAALDAVRQWRYAPTYVNGVAVPVVMTVNANFALK